MKGWCDAHPNAVTAALIVLLIATQALAVYDQHVHGYTFWSWDNWLWIALSAIEINWVRCWWRRS